MSYPQHHDPDAPLCIPALQATLTFIPVISALEKRLEPEVRFRAEAHGQDKRDALAEFHGNMESFRQQVKQRRQFQP